MKQISQAAVLSLFLLLIISHTSANLPLHQLGENPEKKLNEITLQQADDFFSLMGLEECGDEDIDACEKRRIVAEAHLDYIYTQHHKP